MQIYFLDPAYFTKSGLSWEAMLKTTNIQLKFLVDLRKLPSHHSNLTERECSQERYDQALKVWSHFSCSTLKDYFELYLKTDVFLLTVIFKNFRKICMQIYFLDPAYFTKSGLSWEAMLKTTNIQLKFWTVIDMYRFI